MQAFVLVLFSIFILNFIKSLSIPSEESFKILNPNEYTKFSLEGDDKEEYFLGSFDNNEKDILVRFINANVYTVKVYIYKSYGEITKNGDGEYSGYYKMLELGKSKEFIIKGESEKNAPGKFYFIIKDIKGYFFTDYIYFLPEDYHIKLNDMQPFQISLFMSSKQYFFEFDHKADESVELIATKENEEGNSIVYTLTEKETGKEVFNRYEDNINYSLNTEKTEAKSYILIVKKEVDTSEQKIINIMIHKKGVKFVNLVEKETVKMTTLKSEDFFYKVDMERYFEDENNILTFGKLFEDSSITYDVNCKTVVTENKDEEISKEALWGDSECLQYNVTGYNQYKYYYFARTGGNIKGKKHILAIKVSIKIKSYTLPREFTIALSERITFSDVGDTDVDTKNFQVADYIPAVYSFIIPTNFEFSYAFYVSKPRGFNILNGNLTDKNDNPSPVISQNQIFVVTNKKSSVQYSTITIVFFSPEERYSLTSLFSEDYIYYLTGTRPEKVFPIDFKNCQKPFYVIGSYDEQTTSSLYIREHSGKFHIKVKQDFDEDTFFETVLPLVERYNTNSTFSTLNKKLESIYVNCTSPGKVDILFLSEKTDAEVKKDSMNTFKITKNVELAVQLPNTNGKLNIGIMTTLNTTIKGNIGSDEFELNSDKKMITMFDVQSGAKIELNAKQDTVVTIIVTDTETKWDAIKLTGEYPLKSENIVFKIPEIPERGVYNFTLKNVKNDFYYAIQTYPEKYLDKLPTAINYDSAKKVLASSLVDGTFNFTFANPNKLYNLEKKDMYLTISFEEGTDVSKYTVAFNVSVISALDTLDKGYQIFNKGENIYRLKQEGLDKKYVVSVQACGENSIAIRYTQNGVKQEEKPVPGYYSVAEFDSIGTIGELEGVYYAVNNTEDKVDNYEGFLVSYKVINKYEKFDKSVYEKFENNSNRNIIFEEKSNSFTWKKIEEAKSYTYIIMNKTNDTERYKNNSCYLNWRNNSEPKEEIETVDSGETHDEEIYLNRVGNFTINVIAHLENPFNNTVVYNGLNVEIKEIKEPKKKIPYTLIYCVLGILTFIVIGVLVYLIKRNRMKNTIPENDSPLLDRNELL